jgi:calcineurin-like phosphoesterase family protein
MSLDRSYVISDLHLGDEKVLTYVDERGTQLRPFSTMTEYENTIINNWNNVVEDGDLVYLLGDIIVDKEMLPLMDELNGDKILVGGNWDRGSPKSFARYFKDVRGAVVLPKENLILTHYPIHPISLGVRWLNVHGHLHLYAIDDDRYINCGVEGFNYTPKSLSEILKDFERQKGGRPIYGKVPS